MKKGPRLATLLACPLLLGVLVPSHSAIADSSASAQEPASSKDKSAKKLLKLRATLMGHTKAVSAVSFSADGKLLASGSDDGSIRIWDTATGKEVKALGGDQQVGALAFSPDGKLLASASNGPDAVKIWDVATGEEKVNLTDNEGPFGGHVTFSPDGNVLAAGVRLVVSVWDAATGKKLATIKGEESDSMWNHSRPTFAADSKILVLGSGTIDGVEGSVHLWNWSEDKSAGSLNAEGNCSFLALTADGKTLTTLNKHGELTLWDFETSQERTTLKLKETSPASLDLLVNYGPVAALAADGKILAIVHPGIGAGKGFVDRVNKKKYATNAGRFALLNTTTGKALETVSLDAAVTCVAFSPKGELMAAGCRGKDERFPLREVAGDPGLPQGSKGAFILANEAEGDRDGIVRIWEIREPLLEPQK
jgi:WD40 repeat protein